MFSGIIQTMSSVLATAKDGHCLRVRVKKPARWKLAKGQSISVDGICSTVMKVGKGFFEVEYMPETLSKTTAASFQKGRGVNLERSLRYGDLIDGHFVQGHVDNRGVVTKVEKKGRSKRVAITPLKSLMSAIASHGSVAVNGVSLTVANKTKTHFTVALIPFTLSHTNLDALKKGDAVNIETDHDKVILYATTRIRKTRRT